MFEGGWALIGWLVLCLLVYLSKEFDWFEDPNNKKKIDGDRRLVALKTFVCKGRTIEKGTKGGFIDYKAEVDLTDCSWVEYDSQIKGTARIIVDSYVKNSVINNWCIVGSEIIDCDIQDLYLFKDTPPIHYIHNESLTGKMWNSKTYKIEDKRR